MEKFVLVFGRHYPRDKKFKKQKWKYADSQMVFDFDFLDEESAENERWVERDGLICLVLGYITNAEEVKSMHNISSGTMAEMIIDLYQKNWTGNLYDVEGLYVVIIYDKMKETLYVIPSYLGYYLPVYYTVVENNVFISSSLKELLVQSNITRTLNMSAVGKMMYHRTMIPGRNTLVEGVDKLLPTTYMELALNSSGVKIKRYPDQYRINVGKKYAESNLLASIESQVKKLYQMVEDRNVATTLTAGFDTNILLYYLKMIQSGKLDVYSIDGGGKNSEIDIVNELFKKYEKVNGKIDNISHELVGEFPDIVWKVEGYLFDEGLFLRHVLSMFLQKNSVEAVFLGSAADQVMMQIDKYIRWMVRPLRKLYYYLSNKEWEEEMIRGSFMRMCKGDLLTIYRYGILIDCNLKLHGLLMNSCGIMPLYPFVNRMTYSVSKKIGLKNRAKKYYKEKVRGKLESTLGKDLINRIQKSGNVIDIKKYYMENRDTLNRVLNKELSEKILGKGKIEKIKSFPEKHSSLILQLVYIYLFEELILSGKYDNKFNMSDMKIGLNEILN